MYQLALGVGAQGRTEARMEQLSEAPPWQRALVALNLDIPQLNAFLQIVRGHPDLVLLGNALLVEVGFATIDEDERIRLAIKPREVELLESRRPVVVVFAVVRSVRTRR